MCASVLVFALAATSMHPALPLPAAQMNRSADCPMHRKRSGAQFHQCWPATWDSVFDP